MSQPVLSNETFAVITHNYQHYKVRYDALRNFEAIRLSDGTLLSKKEMLIEASNQGVHIFSKDPCGSFHLLKVVEAEQISQEEYFEMRRRR
jgi:hypothetical protein